MRPEREERDRVIRIDAVLLLGVLVLTISGCRAVTGPSGTREPSGTTTTGSCGIGDSLREAVGSAADAGRTGERRD